MLEMDEQRKSTPPFGFVEYELYSFVSDVNFSLLKRLCHRDDVEIPALKAEILMLEKQLGLCIEKLNKVISSNLK